MRLLLALILMMLPSLGRAQVIDYDIANQAFPAFRADLNNHLEAIVTQNAGTVAPATTFPYMVWADTSGAAPILRYRNAANSGWAPAFRIDPSATMWLGGITTGSATITGGSINGTPVGASTPASGRFTTLDASGTIRSTAAIPSFDLAETDAGNATHNRNRLSRDANVLRFSTVADNGVPVSNDYEMTIGASGVTAHSWRIAGVERLRIQDGTSQFFQAVRAQGVSPMQHNAHDLGDLGLVPGASPPNRWRFIYLTNAPNVSSDARLKNSIEDVAEAECRAADRIQIRRYKMNSEPEGPWHFGAIAQEVIAAFEAEGLDWRDYAIVTGSEAATYGVAYDELQSLKLACM